MHDCRTVANRFLDLAFGGGDSLTPMQLLKLTYIAHGWSLGLYGRALIRDEVQAWKYGPVIPVLYNALRHYRAQPVDENLPAPPNDELTTRELDIVRQTYNIYGNMSGVQLSSLTHQTNTPWALTYRDSCFGIVIPTDLIEEHYRRLAAA
jgi:uncharacterized phage-associated protein